MARHAARLRRLLPGVLARALELAPQSDDIRLLLGRELITAGRDVAAMIILRPLLYAPHGGPAAAQARDLFDHAHARSQTSAAP